MSHVWTRVNWPGVAGFLSTLLVGAWLSQAEATSIKYTETSKPGTPVYGIDGGIGPNGPFQKITPVFPPSNEKLVAISFEITPAQIQAVGNIITSITTTIIDLFDPFKKIKGIFDNFFDLGANFDLEQNPIACSPTIPVGCTELVLIPKAPLTQPGTYGQFSFSYDVDASDFGRAGFVRFDVAGDAASEVIFGQVLPVPAPPALALFALGWFGLMSFVLAKNLERQIGA